MLLPWCRSLNHTLGCSLCCRDTHSPLNPFPMSIKASSPFSLGLFQSIESFHELGGMGVGGGEGGLGREGEKRKGEQKKKENDLLSICAVVILKMLNWVNVYT